MLDNSSKIKLKGVHPDLVKVVHRASEITSIPFKVTCGLRTVEEQTRLVKAGASRTMNSMHLPAPKTKLSHAIDLVGVVDGKFSWAGPVYYKLADAMFKAGKELGIPITWGGNWSESMKEPAAKFFDGPHFQLLKSKYIR